MFRKAINWAKQYSKITDDEIDIMIKAKRSLLLDGINLWKKKGDVDFNIAMGSWDEAESTDIVGLYLLSKMKQELNANVGHSLHLKSTKCPFYEEIELNIYVQHNLFVDL